jgi:hypothetical protein
MAAPGSWGEKEAAYGGEGKVEGSQKAVSDGGAFRLRDEVLRD